MKLGARLLPAMPKHTRAPLASRKASESKCLPTALPFSGRSKRSGGRVKRGQGALRRLSVPDVANSFYQDQCFFGNIIRYIPTIPKMNASRMYSKFNFAHVPIHPGDHIKLAASK